MIFSNTEFYYADPSQIRDNDIVLDKEETKHITLVMRHNIGDSIYVTNGIGKVFESEIIKIEPKKNILLKIKKSFKLDEKFANITFFLPILKTSDRLEFAIEKCVELGITNFVIYSAEKSYKRGIKLERWNKLGIAAMKQSLQAYKPTFTFSKKLKLDNNYQNIVFDQLGEKKINEIAKTIIKEKRVNFIFGPEAGLTETEVVNIPNKILVKLNKNRLRAETAIISAAAFISSS